MNADELDHRICIEENQPVIYPDGTRVENWVTLATLWAAYEAKSGREFFAALKINSEVNAVFRIRNREDISNKIRITMRGRKFDILFINDSKKFAGELILACREVK